MGFFAYDDFVHRGFKCICFGFELRVQFRFCILFHFVGFSSEPLSTLMKLIEEKADIPVSKIWSLQDHFYSTKGIEAWDEDLVPSRTTTNCYIADVYAAVIAAFIEDCSPLKEPVMVIEVGAGNGLLASRIIHRLQSRLPASGDGPVPFEYYLTDGAESNLEHWKQIPRFKHLTDQGVLKLGTLWIDDKLAIKTEFGVVTEEDLGNRPVVVVTNYLHGTIPCDLYRVKEGKLYRELITLHEKHGDSMLESDGTGIFHRIVPEFDSVEVDEPNTGNAVADAHLRDYRNLSGNRCIPVPLVSMGFLEIFLRRKAPFMNLIGDLGLRTPEEFRSNPPFLFDDYFAYYNNIHMLCGLVENAGGHCWLPQCRDRMFVCGAFVHSDRPLPQTDLEASIRFEDHPPFDTYQIRKLVDNTDQELSWREMGAWLRTTRCDPDLAESLLLGIADGLIEDSYDELRGLVEPLVESVYMSFPALSDDYDFDLDVIQLLLRLKKYDEALELTSYGLEQLGGTEELRANRYYFAAMACAATGQLKEAKGYLQSCLQSDPAHEKGIRLQRKLAGENVDGSLG